MGGGAKPRTLNPNSQPPCAGDKDDCPEWCANCGLVDFKHSLDISRFRGSLEIYNRNTPVFPRYTVRVDGDTCGLVDFKHSLDISRSTQAC